MSDLTGDLLEQRYVPLSQVVLWDRNPKRHDIGALVQAIRRYGFRDAVAYDAALGALVYGNGRAEALMWMKAQGEKPPRGVGVNADGEWCMPVAFGVDAESKAQAEAFGVDHNNLTLAGGDYTAADMARLWDADYTDLLEVLAEADALPETVSGDDLDALLNAEFAPDTYDILDKVDDIGRKEAEDVAASLQHESRFPLAIVLTRQQRATWERYKHTVNTTNDTRAFLELLDGAGMSNA